MLKRTIEAFVEKYIKDPKYGMSLLIWGPRRSGKTTLLQSLSQKYSLPIFNFDLYSDREKFIPDKSTLEKLASEHKTILIDEVQNFPESTLAIKILLDQFGVKVVATGSSELRQKSKDFDTLAGRYSELFCLPLSSEEILKNFPQKEYEKNNFLQKTMENLILYGAYPEIYLEPSEPAKIDLLQRLLDSYVLKDVIDIYNLKNNKLAKDILTKISLQIGSEVSIREIANSLQANVATVSNYIEIFVKNYILIGLPSFKTNLRRAISENRKLYFYDLGIRNILVKDFRSLDLRPDKGAVFENFIVSEIEKERKIHNIKKALYFYREYGGKEVDLVLEDYKKRYVCAEIKTNEEKVQKIFPIKHRLELISQNNYYAKIQSILSEK